MTRILVIDNYDSFVYTIVDYLRLLGAKTTVVQLLLDEGADASLRNAAGQDAVDMALAQGNTKSAVLLRNWSAQSNKSLARANAQAPAAATAVSVPAAPAASTEDAERGVGTTFTGTGTGRP